MRNDDCITFVPTDKSRVVLLQKYSGSDKNYENLKLPVSVFVSDSHSDERREKSVSN